MNEWLMPDRTATDGEPSPASGGTMFNFLDVADLLYERIGTALGEVGLSYPKYEVLAFLRRAEDAVSLGILAEGQKCARSNITQIIDRLEAEGLVRRVPDPGDRRSVLAELTAHGAALVQDGAAQIDRLRVDFADRLGKSDCAELERLLAKLR